MVRANEAGICPPGLAGLPACRKGQPFIQWAVEALSGQLVGFEGHARVTLWQMHVCGRGLLGMCIGNRDAFLGSEWGSVAWPRWMPWLSVKAWVDAPKSSWRL